MKLKKLLAIGLVCSLAVGMASGCSLSKNNANDGKIRISVGKWPEKGTDDYDVKMKQVERFQEKYPDIVVEGDTYSYSIDTFTAKATAGTLPTIIPTWFTEVNKIISAGYAADLTDALDKAGWLDQMNKDIVKYVSDKDGNVYGIPFKVYAQGLYINKPLFEQVGLVDGNGDVMIPKTYDELYEAAKTIKEKTGKAGFGLPTINNNGGWHTINIAWAYGAEFLSKSSDGKYTSNMNTPETVAAYEWVKKMREAKVFPDNPNLVMDNLMELFAAGQLAMMFGEPNYIASMAVKFGKDPKEVVLASIPEGPKGRTSQMGGDLYMIAANATPEQIDACLKWIDFNGNGPTLEDEAVVNLKENLQSILDQGGAVLSRDIFYLWTSEDRVKKLSDARSEFANVPDENFADYIGFEGVTLMPEPEVGCQELYSELDKVVQEIYSDSNADVASLIKKASDNWQANCLDNLK